MVVQIQLRIKRAQKKTKLKIVRKNRVILMVKKLSRSIVISLMARIKSKVIQKNKSIKVNKTLQTSISSMDINQELNLIKDFINKAKHK